MDINKESIIEIIKEVAGSLIEIETLEDGKPLTDQGVDSLDMTSIFLEIEERFEVSVPDEDYNKLHSINDIIAYLKDK